MHHTVGRDFLPKVEGLVVVFDFERALGDGSSEKGEY